MMPAPTNAGGKQPGDFLLLLPPNRVSLDRMAKVRVESGGQITHATAVERQPWNLDRPKRRLHWAEGIGSWEEL